MYRVVFFFFFLFFGFSVNAAELNPSSIDPPRFPDWTKNTENTENIVAEFYGYHWWTEGKANTTHTWLDAGGILGLSKLRYNTDANLYIIGLEIGGYLDTDTPFLRRVTASFETSRGSTGTMRGTDADPVFIDGTFEGFLSFQEHRGDARIKYISASVYLRPLEGEISKEVRGYFDIFGEWLKYEDKRVIKSVTQTHVDFVDIPDFTFAGAPNPIEIRHEGAGIGLRGGLGFFDMFKLETRFAWYPDMSARQTALWDVPINRKFVFSGENARGFVIRPTLGFTPFRERKHIEFEVGYQYMQFKQRGGSGRVQDLTTGDVANIEKWDRASSYRDGFFVGGTLRW